MKNLLILAFVCSLTTCGLQAQNSYYPQLLYKPEPGLLNGISSCGLIRPWLLLSPCITPLLFDWDQDGLVDLFYGRNDGKITYFRNTGSKTNPCFEWVTDNFGGLSVPAGFAAPFIVDLDNNGVQDFVIGNGISSSVGGTFHYFKGVGTVHSPQFVLVEDTLAGYDLSDASVPFLTDSDGDGDFDLFAGEGYGRSSFIENTGTPENPIWGPVITLSHDLGWRSVPQIVNIRGDWKKEWISFESFGQMHIADNISTTADTAIWKQPFTLFTDIDYCQNTSGCVVRGSFADLNGDDLLDIVVTSSNVHTMVYNTGTAESPVFDMSDVQTLPIKSEEYPAAFTDLDQDGKLEMYVPKNDGKIRAYELEGSGTNMVWNVINEDFLNFSTTYAKAIAFGDLNQDGLDDAVVGFIGAPEGKIMQVFINQGQSNAPNLVYTPSPALENYPFLNTAIPSLMDYEKNGEMDLIVSYSTVLRFRNSGNNGLDWTPATLTGLPNNLSATQLTFGDADGDGDKDAIRSGFSAIGYFENKGSDELPDYVFQPQAFPPDMKGNYSSMIQFSGHSGMAIWLDDQFWSFQGIKPSIQSVASTTLCSNMEPRKFTALPAGGEWQGADANGFFYPGQGAGSYLIIYHFTDLYGCQEHTDSVWVYVNQAPNSDIVTLNGALIPDDTVVVCQFAGAQTLETAENCGYFTGSVSSTGTFNPSTWQPGIYQVVHYCVVNSCADYDTLYLQIVNAPVPLFVAINGQPVDAPVIQLCTNSGIQQFSASPEGGIFGGIATSSGTIDPSALAPGTYSATYTVEVGGCASSVEIAVVVATCVSNSSEALAANLMMRLFPNPPGESPILIEVEISEKSVVRLERYDLIGRLTTLIQPDHELAAGKHQWQDRPFNSSAYWYVLTVNGSVVSRLVVNK